VNGPQLKEKIDSFLADLRKLKTAAEDGSLDKLIKLLETVQDRTIILSMIAPLL
jgi:hypothetical protein